MFGLLTSSHVEKLRQEVRIIRGDEHLYRQAQYHTLEEIRAHTDRRSRLLEIRSQLDKILLLDKQNGENDGVVM